MTATIQKVITWVLIFGAIVLISYIAYQFYNYAVIDATARIKQGVTEGVSEGIGTGIGETVNPLNWPSKVFGGNR